MSSILNIRVYISDLKYRIINSETFIKSLKGIINYNPKIFDRTLYNSHVLYVKVVLNYLNDIGW